MIITDIVSKKSAGGREKDEYKVSSSIVFDFTMAQQKAVSDQE
jgi:hypothetical protein